MIRAFASAPASRRGQHRLARHLMQLDVAIAARAGGRRVPRDQRRVAVAQQAGIAFEFGAAAAAEQGMQRLARALAAQMSQSAISMPEKA